MVVITIISKDMIVDIDGMTPSSDIPFLGVLMGLMENGW